jgi:hypothetical protein
MTNLNLNQYTRSLTCALASALLLASCSGDEATIVDDRPGSGSVANAGSGGGSNTDATGAGGGAGTDASACVETPAVSQDYLNRCTTSACRAFDNEQRLGLYQAGQPLPEVP